jgi:hypothetical protein
MAASFSLIQTVIDVLSSAHRKLLSDIKNVEVKNARN